MKKFYTIISLQANRFEAQNYVATDNDKLNRLMPVHFPILNAVNGYVENGEQISVIAVVFDCDPCRNNFDIFKRELAQILDEKGCPDPIINEVIIPSATSVNTQMKLFQRLTDFAEDEDELYGCLTYGTKPMTMAMLMAIQYAYKVKLNTLIGCIVYGEIDRPSGNPSEWKAYIHDFTALVQMNELVNMLANNHVADPRKAIDAILSE